jgi:hypothetical protein
LTIILFLSYLILSSCPAVATTLSLLERLSLLSNLLLTSAQNLSLTPNPLLLWNVEF